MTNYSLIKKIICTGFMLMICCIGAVAGNKDSTQFRFGAKVGAGSTYLTHHHLYMLGDSRITFTLGVLGEYWFNSWMAVNASVEYTHKGGSMLDPRLFYAKDSPMISIPELGKSLHSTNLTIHTIEIPLTVRFALPIHESAFKPFFMVGPSFGHNFYARADNYYLWEFDGASNDLLDETSDMIIEKIASWNISVYLGLGTEIQTKQKFCLETGINFRLGMTYEDRFLYTLYHKYSTISTLAYIAIKW